MDKQYEDLKNAAKNLALIKHENDTDDMLRQTIANNNRIIQGLPNTAVVEILKHMGELEGCSEILKQRQREKDRKKEEIENWIKGTDKRKEDALLSLNATASFSGQLVCAILEDEDFLSAEELHGWCEELSDMEDDAFAKLLEDLTAEGVIGKNKSDKFFLRFVCSDDPQWSAKAVEKFLSKTDAYQPKTQKLMIALPYIIGSSNKPQSAKECADFLPEMGDDWLQENFDLKASDISVQKCNSALLLLKREGIFASPVYDHETNSSCYAFACIGKENKE